MEEAMQPHINEVIGREDDDKGFDDFDLSREAFETYPFGPEEVHSQPKVERIYAKADKDVPRSPPFHKAPILPFPRLLQTGLNLVLFVGFAPKYPRT